MHEELRTDDVCDVCKKKNLSVVNYTTSGSLILLLVECFKCGLTKTITRKLKEEAYGKVKGMDSISPVNSCSG